MLANGLGSQDMAPCFQKDLHTRLITYLVGTTGEYTESAMYVSLLSSNWLCIA